MKKKKLTLAPPGPTSRGSDKFILRLPDGMREHLAGVAARRGRSMNAEVITALALYFAHEGLTVEERFESNAPFLVQLLKAVKELTEEVVELRKGKQ